MTEQQRNELARDWIAHWHDPKREETWESRNQSFWRLRDLVEAHPAEAWLVILAIHEQDKSDKIAGGLSAGPLENLLAKHGPEIIETVAIHARRNPSFAKLLCGVWGNRMTEEVWQRVVAARNPRGYDGIPEE